MATHTLLRDLRAFAPALLLAAACSGGARSGGGGAGGGGGGGGSPPSCHLAELGSTCTMALAPYDVQDVFFTAPGTGQGLVDVSLTGSTTIAVGYLLEFDSSKTPCSDFTYGIDQSCVLVVNGGASYHFIVTETEGRAGVTSVTIARGQSLGSAASPVPLSTDSLVNASVGASGASYFSFEAAASASHTIGITGLFTQLSWELFDDPGYQDLVVACTSTPTSADLACSALLTAGVRYYLRVRELAGAPQEFRIAIGTGGGDEGSIAIPSALTVGGPSRTSTVDVFGHSYYAFTPAASGLHSIQLDGHSELVGAFSYSFPSDYGWTLFDDPGFTHPVADCRDYRQIRDFAGAFEHCLALLVAGVPYYLRVDEQAGFPNRMCELTVVQRTGGGGTSEGSIGAPVVVTFTDGFGTVAAHGSSYYAFQNGPSAGSYRIIVSPRPDSFFFPGSNLAWFLFDDAGFSHEIARCERARGIVAQSCLTPELSASTTYHLRVDENDGIPEDFSFSLHGGFAPPAATSVDAPIAIPVGTPGIHVVQDNTLSTGFYAFATPAAGTYRVEADLATGDAFALVAWQLYDDAAFSHPVAHCYRADGLRSRGASCTVSLPGPASLYLEVRAVAAQSGNPGSTIIGNNDLHLIVAAAP